MLSHAWRAKCQVNIFNFSFLNIEVNMPGAQINWWALTFFIYILYLLLSLLIYLFKSSIVLYYRIYNWCNFNLVFNVTLLLSIFMFIILFVDNEYIEYLVNTLNTVCQYMMLAKYSLFFCWGRIVEQVKYSVINWVNPFLIIFVSRARLQSSYNIITCIHAIYRETNTEYTI